MNRLKINKKNNWLTYILVLLGVFIFVLVYSSMSAPSGNVPIINIDGLIQFSSGDMFSTSSSFIEEKIYDLADDPNVEGMILRINSPGGTPVASNRISNAVEYFSNQNKTVVSVIDEMGASGAYLIASASDKIFLDEMSIVGSIGVKSSRLSLEGLLRDYNISYYSMSSGDYKDFGDVLVEPTDEELEAMKGISEDLHTKFSNIVMENRNISKNFAEENNLFSGLIFLGSDAIEYDLVDSIGGMKEAEDYLYNDLNQTLLTYPVRRDRGFFESAYGFTKNIISEDYLNLNLRSPFLFVFDR